MAEAAAGQEGIMAIVRWDPVRELEEMSTRLGRLVGFAPRTFEEEGALFRWAPAVDVEEDDKEYVVKADLPEVKKEQVKVNILHGMLAIEGERQQEREEKTKKVHRLERAYGKFVRRLEVPADVDTAKVRAEYKDGVLLVHLPMSPTAKPSAIDVQVS